MEMAFIIWNVISCSFLHMKCNIQVIYFMFPNFFFFLIHNFYNLVCVGVFWGPGVWRRCFGGIIFSNVIMVLRDLDNPLPNLLYFID